MMQDMRRELIAAELEHNKYMSVEALAARFNCSVATVRRDLLALEADRRIRRFRGGARATDGVVAADPVAVPESADPMLEAKRRIARAAAALVNDGDTVGLNGGTTAREVARCLAGRRVGVVTNSIDALLALTTMPGPRIVVVGGELGYSWGCETIGPLAEMMLSHLSMDTVFASVNGVSAEAGVLMMGDLDGQILRVMTERARRLVVVADHTKIGRAAIATLFPITRVSILVTDDAGPCAALDAIRQQGVQVIET